MLRNWLVYCKYCNCGTTIAPQPGSIDFAESISCALCNRKINARNGKLTKNSVTTRKPPVYDYLSVD